jgi:hypothetical protein
MYLPLDTATIVLSDADDHTHVFMFLLLSEAFVEVGTVT